METFKSANSYATPSRAKVFLLACLTALLLLPGAALAAVSVSYSDFGPGNSFHPFPDAWCVSGANATNCDTFHVRVIAAPVVPQANLTLSQVKIALNWVIGTNSGTLKLVNDAGGSPGTTVLESWALSNLPSTTAPAAVTLNSTGGVTLLGGVRYWLVASAPNTSTMLVWFTNSLDLDGGVTSLDNGPWTLCRRFHPSTEATRCRLMPLSARRPPAILRGPDASAATPRCVRPSRPPPAKARFCTARATPPPPRPLAPLAAIQ